jgi:hypothetical protein
MAIQTRITPFDPKAGRLMITDGGPHPAEAWAQVTAEHIAPLGPDVTGRRRARGLELQLAIAAALEPHHQTVQDTERGKLIANLDHIANPVDPEPHLDEAMTAIAAAAKGTEWEAHFNDPERLALMRLEVGTHFATAQHIEKSWHADRNPTHPAAKAFRAAHHGEGVN